MRPGPELDHELAVLLGWWLPEDDAVSPETPIYRPPRFWSHLPAQEGPPPFSSADPSAIQLLTLLELAAIPTEVAYPKPPSTQFVCTIEPPQHEPLRVSQPTLPAAVAIAVWVAREVIGPTLHARAISTTMIAINPRTAPHAVVPSMG